MYVGFCDMTLRHIHTYIAYIMYSSWAELSLAVWGSVLYVPSNCCPLCAVLVTEQAVTDRLWLQERWWQ